MKTPKEQHRIRRKNRIRARISGSTVRPRLVVYRSNQAIYAQLIDDTTGKTLVAATDLSDKKGTKVERAKQVGTKLAASALQSKIETCVFDRNAYKYHGRVKALAEGAREGGLKF